LSEPTTRSAAAPASAGLARKKYVLLAACFALLASSFAAYHFWPRSNPPSGPSRTSQISHRILAERLISEAEFRKRLAELNRHLDDTGTLVISHLFVQVWGRKSKKK
jgi:hypothetical protein